MKYQIHLYHGVSQKYVDKLNSFCEPFENGWWFYGTLEEFAEKWGYNFAYRHDLKLIMPTIYNSFGAR